MLRWLWQFLLRFRWPCVAGVFVFVALAYLLQPRPMAEYIFTPKKGQEVFSFERMSISPSGRFAIFFDDIYRNLSFIELASGRVVFECLMKDWSECRFDDEDGLVYATFGPRDETIECWRWLPGTGAPSKIFERPSFLPGVHLGEGQHSSFYQGCIARFEDGTALNSFLSPDARSWLIPVRNQKSFHFELVDSRTGQHQLNLESPLIQPAMNMPPVCEVAFSADSKLIVMQYPLPEENKRDETSSYVMEVHSAETGKRIRNDYLPFRTKLEQLIYFDGKQLLAIDNQHELQYLQAWSIDHGYQRYLMKETVGEPMEQGATDPKEAKGTGQAHIEMSQPISSADGKLIYCWQHQDIPRFGGIGGGIPYRPGFYFACRDIETGQLIHTERLLLRKRSAQDPLEDGWQLLGILPKHVLLLKEPVNASYEERMLGKSPPQWKQTLESWREKYAIWLPSLLREDTHLVCMDATTGKIMDRLSLRIDQPPIACHVPQQQSLYLGVEEKDGFRILQYAYPFRRPWLLILAWSLGIFAILACLQLLFRMTSRLLRKKQAV